MSDARAMSEERKQFRAGLALTMAATAFALFGLVSACGVTIFSLEDETAMGRKVAAEIEANPKEYPPYRGDPAVERYVNEVFHNLLPAGAVEYQEEFAYQVRLIDKGDAKNAFALPGGFIYVYTGLLGYLDSEAALAGVLAHEIGHCERRHASKRITSYYGAQVALSLVLGRNPGMMAELAANLFTGMAFLANSRSDEREADEFSIDVLADTKYYPGGMTFFFEKMRAKGETEESSDFSQLFKTHPAPLERIDEMNERLMARGITLKSYGATGEGIFRERYQREVVAKLR
ncbi:MAG: M48 family metalloprotease [Ignavibacteriales bacterium]|nr:M48 family metalloprotease [Ignavibacteriales bacterium]